MSDREAAQAHVLLSSQGHQTALHRAAMVGNSDIIDGLIKGGCALDLQDKDGNTALHEVSWHGFCQSVKLLVKAGADVHARNKAGNTALHLACQNANAQSAHVLLLGGSRPDIKNNVGDTCLHVAARYNHLAMIKILVGALCSGTEKNKAGPSLILCREDCPGQARDYNHKDVSLLLARAPQKKNEWPSDLHRKSRLCTYDEAPPTTAKPIRIPLYRDKDGNVKQAPANGCHCKPLIKRLEGELNATKEEMRTQMLTVQEQVYTRLGRMDRKSIHQIKVLDMLTQERVAAERMECLYRMDQRAAQGREEAQRRQAAATQELKRWCMTQIQDMDLHLPADPQYYKLLPSPSVGDDGDSECLPLLSVFSGDSSSSLATYVNLLPCPSPSPTHNAPHSLAMEQGQGQGSGRKYFELKLDRSPDNYQNTTLLPLPAHHHHPGILLSSTAPRCQHPERLDNHIPGLIWEGCSSSVSSSQSPTSNWKQGRGQDSHGWHHRKHLRDRIRTRGLMRPPSVGTRTLEFFMDRPPEPTFSQERNNLHAMEVTQRFFETVSTQLECWYERKIQDAKRQAELRAQQDRAELLQRIRSLEEELEQLRMTNGSTDS
nr:ankyrin repeat domain-containing protein 6 [Salvelinus alpinus]